MKETPDQLKADIKQRFVKLALAPREEQKFPVGAASAKQLGYDGHEIDSLPYSVTESFVGVGNPLALGELRAGQTVLDLGSGAGLDSILAARRVGPAGKVIGVDFASEMYQGQSCSINHYTSQGRLWRTVESLIDEIYLDDVRGALEWDEVLTAAEKLVSAASGVTGQARLRQAARAFGAVLSKTRKRRVPIRVLAPQKWFGKTNSATAFDPGLIADAIEHGRLVARDKAKWLWP
jgi:SAM-dependent methyltransferase